MEREYIVTLNKGVDYEQFNQEMIASTGAGNIPQRSVDVAYAKPASQRITHYALTDDEADTLKNDPRVTDVELPWQDQEGVEIGHFATQTGNFNKTSSPGGQYYDWGKIRHSITENAYGTSTDTDAVWPYSLDGTGVDVVIQDSGLQVDHPEFAIDDLDVDYRNGSIINVTGDGSDFFKREVTTNGVRIMGAGGVGGQTAVPDAWLEKVARMFELFLDPNAAGINKTYQRNLIKTLRGDAGTWHAGLPTIQRVARGAGADYTPNFLTDQGVIDWNLTNLFDTHVANDMVWYLNSTGDGYGDGDTDAQEVIEHVFHTLHMYGLPADDIKLYQFLAADWQSGDLYAAMEEAYDAGKWDPSGYQENPDDWKTIADAFEVAAKEYLYLLNFCMFEYTELWDGGSLAPEWSDDMRTQAGIQANNPLGYAFHNTYIAPVISKPPLATIRSIFQDGNTPAQDNPAIAGGSGYVADTGYRVHQINWGDYGVNFFNQANHDRDFDGHGTHVGGTAAGLNFGWAKNARIYSVKVSGLEGTGDSGGISTNDCFDCIKLWHRNKPIDPVTGRKRPTIVNMSWGYGTNWNNSPTDILYRGVTYNNVNDPAFDSGSAYIWGTYGVVPTGRINVRLSYIDAEVEELLDEGIHVCIAAGNNYHYIDESIGQDFNNIVFYSTGSRNYMRGSSPHSTSDRAFIVGNVESSPLNANTERKRNSSECGPGVTIWAAGSNIISCTSTTNKFSDASYFGNAIGEGYRQCNISGTSMASPQVCGVGALYLQAHPEWTPEQLRDRIIKDSIKNVMNDSGATNYTDTDSITGGNNRLLYNRYSNATPFSIQGPLSTTSSLNKR